MGKKSNQIVRVVTVNPEAIEQVKEKFTKFIYEQYTQALRDGHIKPSDE